MPGPEGLVKRMALPPPLKFPSLTLQEPPSLQLTKFHKHFPGTRQLHCKLLQVLLGHCFVGEYYKRFVPSIPLECPCGAAFPQTITHTLFTCTLHETARHHLFSHSNPISTPVLLGTTAGLTALTSFLRHTNAFSPHNNNHTPPFPTLDLSPINLPVDPG